MGNKINDDAIFSKNQENSRSDDEKEHKSNRFTKLAENTQNKNNIIKVNVKTYNELRYERDNLIIYCEYSKQEKVKNLFEEIRKYREPTNIHIWSVGFGSFTGRAGMQAFQSVDIETIGNKSMVDYNKSDIIKDGLSIEYRIYYNHKIKDVSITCEFMNDIENPLSCPIYFGAKEKYNSNQDILSHLEEFVHCKNVFESKPKCKYGQNCKAYKRLEFGGNRIDDRIHLKLYHHPPRTRNIKLAENMNSLIINTKAYKNSRVSWYSEDDRKKYKYNDKDGFLKALIEEVIKNGYKYDLCLECGPNDKCKHNNYSILQIVDDKIENPRHKKMGKPLRRDEMLALILYTGCECNYDLCGKQRAGDYKTWRWFDHCLWHAINHLSKKEKGDFSVYSGLNGVKLDKKRIKSGYFVTYVSSSWNKNVAESFIGGNKGMMIKIDNKYKDKHSIYCCDVSWLSKFPDEAEILFARSQSTNWDNFICEVLDESKGIQTVLLKNAPDI